MAKFRDSLLRKIRENHPNSPEWPTINIKDELIADREMAIQALVGAIDDLILKYDGYMEYDGLQNKYYCIFCNYLITVGQPVVHAHNCIVSVSENMRSKFKIDWREPHA